MSLVAARLRVLFPYPGIALKFRVSMDPSDGTLDARAGLRERDHVGAVIAVAVKSDVEIAGEADGEALERLLRGIIITSRPFKERATAVVHVEACFHPFDCTFRMGCWMNFKGNQYDRCLFE